MTTSVSQYRPAPDDRHARYSTVQIGKHELLYVIVALTDLGHGNGLHELLGGSHASRHPRHTPEKHWNYVRTELNPGDALIWRGDLLYMLSPKGGGKSVRDEIHTLASRTLANWSCS